MTEVGEGVELLKQDPEHADEEGREGHHRGEVQTQWLEGDENAWKEKYKDGGEAAGENVRKHQPVRQSMLDADACQRHQVEAEEAAGDDGQHLDHGGDGVHQLHLPLLQIPQCGK